MDKYAIVQAVFMVLFPFVILEVVKRNKIAGMIGPVVLCYLVGIAAGNIPAIPVNMEMSKTLINASIPLAIALLLFSTKFMRWLKHAGKSMFSFFLGVLGVVASSMTISYLFMEKLAAQGVNAWQLAGMMIGVYTGGTPNMAAIGAAVGISEEVFILLNASDLVLGGTYLLLLLTVAQRFALQFLPSFKRQEDIDRYSTFHYQQIASYGEPEIYKKQKEEWDGRFSVGTTRKLVIARSFILSFLLAAVILGASVGLSILVMGEISEPLTLMSVTVLSIAASFVKKIRRLPRTYEFGEYFLLIFCIAIGSISNFTELLSSSPLIFYYTSMVFISCIAIHFILAAIFRIDADTLLITSTAGIYGPAFIGPVASVLKNKDIVVSGLTTGLVGYAIANFLGMGIAYLFKMLFY